jgi:hypothetical protein
MNCSAARRLGLLLVLVLLAPLVVALDAQTQVPSPVPASTRIAFDHDGVNTDRYVLTVDGVDKDLGKLAPVAGTTYETPFPSTTPGAHVLTVCAVNVAGRACSSPFPISVVVTPNAPTTLRIVTQ